MFSVAIFSIFFIPNLATAQILINPTNVTILVGDTVQFSASEPVIWMLEAAPGVDMGSLSANFSNQTHSWGLHDATRYAGGDSLRESLSLGISFTFMIERRRR